jgi:hypothetical protein
MTWLEHPFGHQILQLLICVGVEVCHPESVS